MADTPGISVIVPTHGRPAQLERCIASLLRQRLPQGVSFEVIVVDDGSDPGVTLPGSPPGVVLLRQPQAGPAAARNTGLAAARGPLVAFIDDDCEAAEDWLAALWAAHQQTPGCAYGGRVTNKLPGNVYSETSQLMLTFLRDYYQVAPGEGRFFTSNNLAFEREGLRRAGGFDQRYTRAAGEDRELCDRWVATGGRILFVEDAVVAHAHELTAVRFWRQHRNYGAGAWGFRSARWSRGGGRVRVEPWRFYRDLVWFPIRTYGARGVPMAALVVVAQVANAVGFGAELIRSRRAALFVAGLTSSGAAGIFLRCLNA
jgi:glycosyltransferase involved in cell wall biosynthesis